MRIDKGNQATYTADRHRHTQHIVCHAQQEQDGRSNKESAPYETRWYNGQLIIVIAGLLACNIVNQMLLIYAHHWCWDHPFLHGVLSGSALGAGMWVASGLQERGERR